LQNFSLGDIDWGHVVLFGLLMAAIVSRVRTRHMRRFEATIILKRNALDTASTEKKKDTQSQHDDEGPQEIIPR
jgi:hypothetical protein